MGNGGGVEVGVYSKSVVALHEMKTQLHVNVDERKRDWSIEIIFCREENITWISHSVISPIFNRLQCLHNTWYPCC